MNDAALRIIRTANRGFQEIIRQATESGNKAMGTGDAATLLRKIDQRLKQVAKHLGEGATALGTDSEAAIELQMYRENLTRLRHVVETLQSRLLAEKTRMDNVRANLRAARAWATSLREIS